jgi:hypothetical protein
MHDNFSKEMIFAVIIRYLQFYRSDTEWGWWGVLKRERKGEGDTTNREFIDITLLMSLLTL